MSTKGFERLTVRQLAELTGHALEESVDDSAFRAIEASILHGNTTLAHSVVVSLGMTNQKKFVKQLHLYFEQFGNLRYRPKSKDIVFVRRLTNVDWTPQYADAVRSCHWRTLVPKITKTSDSLTAQTRTTRDHNDKVVDVDKELRSLLARFERAASSGRNVVHAELIKRVSLVIADYNFSDDYKNEEARYKRTLFDKSTARQTIRGNKYAKDLGSNSAGE